jgi:cytochrome P450
LEGELRRIVVERRAHPSDRRGILSILLDTRDEQGSAMTDEELVGQINFLFDASFETTSNSLTWTLFLLSQHPEVAADVHDEITGLLRGQPPTHDQLDQLPLVERVIKESLRLFAPPVYAYRVCSRAVTFGPYDLPKGATVAFSHYMTHHSPELFPEPERFLPKRWETIKPSLYEYLPFGAGAHACLGASFALMTMKTVLAMLIPRFRLSVVPDTRIDRKVLVTLAPKHGMPILVQAQDQQFPKSQTPVRGNIHEMVQLTVVP